jgi:hypothetical protein
MQRSDLSPREENNENNPGILFLNEYTVILLVRCF